MSILKFKPTSGPLTLDKNHISEFHYDSLMLSLKHCRCQQIIPSSFMTNSFMPIYECVSNCTINRNRHIFESKGILAKTKEKEAKCLKKAGFSIF